MKMKHLSIVFAAVFALVAFGAPMALAAEKKATAPVVSSVKETAAKDSAQKAAAEAVPVEAALKIAPAPAEKKAAAEQASPAPQATESTSFFGRMKKFFSSEKKAAPGMPAGVMPPPVIPMMGDAPRGSVKASPAPSMPDPDDEFSVREKALDSKALREAKKVAKLFDVKEKLKGSLRGTVMMFAPMLNQDNEGKMDKIQKSIETVAEDIAEDKEDIVLRNKAITLARIFTVDELEQLGKFLESSVGQKLIKSTNEIDRDDAMYIQKIVMYEGLKAREKVLKEMRRNDLKIPKGME